MTATAVISGSGLRWSRPGAASSGKPGDSSGGREVLGGIDIALQAGELVAISGPSGVGKSVLGSLLLRLRPMGPGGRIQWGDDDVSQLSPGELQPLRRRYQGLLQQTGAILPPFLTVGEALRETIRHVAKDGLNSAQARDQISEITELLGISGLLSRYPRFLSGGEQRKSGVARLLLARPVFAFVDEPDAGLDPVSQHDVLGALRDAVARTGVAMLLVTHNAHLAEQYADRRILLEGGMLHAS